MIKHRRVGVIHFIAIGRIRLSFCLAKRESPVASHLALCRATMLPVDLSLPVERLCRGAVLRRLYTQRIDPEAC